MKEIDLMKIKYVFFRKFTNYEIFDLIRILNGFALLIYYFSVLIPNYDLFFVDGGLVDSKVFSFYPKSWLFHFKENDLLIKFFFVSCLILLLFYTVGYFSKIALLFLLPIHLGFHAANPFIIHEPQQLNNLILLLTLFVPIESSFSLKKRRDIFPELNERHLGLIIWCLVCYISLYYFFAGIKKIPDTSWQAGQAVKDILEWDYLSKKTILTNIISSSFLGVFLTYSTLFFEIFFVFFVFTRLRRWLILLGLVFHFFIGITLDIGLFFWAMLPWYPALLIQSQKKNS